MTQKLKRPFTATARRKSAIAPGWEVQTAKLQDANGLSNAGLSELERSANLGHTTGKPIAQTINGISTLEDWNPIGLGLTSRHYKNRSCLRTYSLGYRLKTHLKTAQNCSKRAANSARNRKAAQKLTNITIKTNGGPLDMCASSYEICSN